LIFSTVMAVVSMVLLVVGDGSWLTLTTCVLLAYCVLADSRRRSST